MLGIFLLSFAGKTSADLRPFVISGTAQGTTYRVTYYSIKGSCYKSAV